LLPSPFLFLGVPRLAWLIDSIFAGVLRSGGLLFKHLFFLWPGHMVPHSATPPPPIPRILHGPSFFSRSGPRIFQGGYFGNGELYADRGSFAISSQGYLLLFFFPAGASFSQPLPLKSLLSFPTVSSPPGQEIAGRLLHCRAFFFPYLAFLLVLATSFVSLKQGPPCIGNVPLEDFHSKTLPFFPRLDRQGSKNLDSHISRFLDTRTRPPRLHRSGGPPPPLSEQ